MPIPRPVSLVLALAPVLALVACTAQPETAPARVAADDDAAPTAPDEASAPDEAPAPAGGAPKIASDAATFDFGTITPTDKVEHVFRIKNEGDVELHIERVQRT